MAKVLMKLISVADQGSFTQRLNDFLARVRGTRPDGDRRRFLHRQQ